MASFPTLEVKTQTRLIFGERAPPSVIDALDAVDWEAEVAEQLRACPPTLSTLCVPSAESGAGATVHWDTLKDFPALRELHGDVKTAMATHFQAAKQLSGAAHDTPKARAAVAGTAAMTSLAGFAMYRGNSLAAATSGAFAAFLAWFSTRKEYVDNPELELESKRVFDHGCAWLGLEHEAAKTAKQWNVLAENGADEWPPVIPTHEVEVMVPWVALGIAHKVLKAHSPPPLV